MSQKLALCETPNPGSSRLNGLDLGQFPGSFRFKRREIYIFPTFFSKKVIIPGSFRFNIVFVVNFRALFKNIVFYDK